jgi:hypothetical protein
MRQQAPSQAFLRSLLADSLPHSSIFFCRLPLCLLGLFSGDLRRDPRHQRPSLKRKIKEYELPF